MEGSNWEETISTCKFSQRVALIKNAVSVNTFVDDKVVIRQLKKENRRIQGELDLLRTEKNLITELGEKEFAKCLDLLKVSLKGDKKAKQILRTFSYSVNWGEYKDEVVREAAHEPLMAIACFNLFVKLIEEKEKLVREGEIVREKKDIREFVSQEEDLVEKTNLVESGKKSFLEKKEENIQEIKRNNFLEEKNELTEQSIQDKENQNLENIEKKTPFIVRQKPKKKIENLEKIEISEEIKNNKDECLKIFKKSKKFAKRFEGLEEDKRLLLQKIEAGKKGSEVKI